MFTIVLALVLGGCSCGDKPKVEKGEKKEAADARFPAPDAPATPAAVRLDQATGIVVWQGLDALSNATFSFPPATPGAGSDGHFLLSGAWDDAGARKGGLHEYTRALPFSTPMPRPQYAPLGAVLSHDGTVIPFSTTLSDPNTRPSSSWYVDRGRIRLLCPDDPNHWTAPGELVVEELAAAIRSRSLATSGRPPVEFARTTLVSGGITRPGLYLPAPTTMEFPVSVPASGKLRFGLGILADPVTGKPSSDGASLSVLLDGKEIWAGPVSTTGDHQEVVVDLPSAPAHAGTLRWATSAGADSSGDYVVVTAPMITDSAPHTPRHILVIGVDTLRWDALSANGAGRPTSPELDTWLTQSVQFTHAYSVAPRTKPSFRTAFTGRYPATSRDASTVAEVLAPEGFVTGGVVGNIHLVPRFGFNRGMDSWEYENGAKATDQVDRALAWAQAHESEDTYQFVHFMDPHTFYDAAPPFKGKFQDGKRPRNIPSHFNRWQIYALMKKDKLTDDGKAWIRAAYDEEVAYTAHEVSRLLSGVDALQGQTLSVIHADHGEEFWDHGQYEHNHTLYNELVHVELAIRPPKGWKDAPKVTDNVGLVDLAATLYDFAGVPAAHRPATDGVSLRPFVDPGAGAAKAALQDTLHVRPLLLGSMRYGRDRWGTILQKYKYILQTASGTQELYDLDADPLEKNNLANTADEASLDTLRAALETSSGWPVRPGFRVLVPSTATETTITFQSPILLADVLDPDLNEQIRANQEWGEVPKKAPTDVGVVVMAPDRKSFTFTPGPSAFGGTLLIQCEARPCPAGELKMGKVKTPFLASRDVGGTGYVATSGTIIFPHDSNDLPDSPASIGGTEIDELETLGYLSPSAGEEQ